MRPVDTIFDITQGKENGYMRYRKNVGDIGEDFAAKLLENSGYRIIARNFATKQGEIDIIALKDGVMHFIEVKTRTGSQYGYPSDSVTKVKQDRIRKAAKSYLSNRRLQWKSISFDVYEIMTDLIEDCM
jgi:putative endonuclease